MVLFESGLSDAQIKSYQNMIGRALKEMECLDCVNFTISTGCSIEFSSRKEMAELRRSRPFLFAPTIAVKFISTLDPARQAIRLFSPFSFKSNSGMEIVKSLIQDSLDELTGNGQPSKVIHDVMGK